MQIRIDLLRPQRQRAKREQRHRLNPIYNLLDCCLIGIPLFSYFFAYAAAKWLADRIDAIACCVRPQYRDRVFPASYICLKIRPSFETDTDIIYEEKQYNGKTEYVITILVGQLEHSGFINSTVVITKTSTRKLSLNQVKRLMRKIDRLDLPDVRLTQNFDSGRDGTIRELMITKHDEAIYMEWWEDLPKEWRTANGVIEVLCRLAGYKWWQFSVSGLLT